MAEQCPREEAASALRALLQVRSSPLAVYCTSLIILVMHYFTSPLSSFLLSFSSMFIHNILLKLGGQLIAGHEGLPESFSFHIPCNACSYT